MELKALIDDLMTAWQEGRGETEIRDSFAGILAPLFTNEAIHGHPQPRKLREVRENLEKLLPKCIVGPGEDYPASYRACVYCGLIEASSIDFHKPDCPVVNLRRLLLVVQWPKEGTASSASGPED